MSNVTDFEAITAKARATAEKVRQGADTDTAKEPAQPYGAWRIADMLKLKPPSYVVEKWIPAGGQSTIFAPSGHYKTMTALDLIIAIAFNRDFHGFKVKACPVIICAREDAYMLARVRLLGLLDYYGLTDERIIVVPDDVSLSDPAVVDRLLATKREYFPGEEPGFAFDPWDKCLDADPDKTNEVLPAVGRVDDLIKAGAPFGLTLAHSPWNNSERSKGSVSFWASQQARMKTERDEATGIGKFDLVHQKNGPSGLHLEFEYLQHPFTVEGETCTCLVPQRIYDAPERAVPKPKPQAPLGAVQRLLIKEFRRLASRNGATVEEDKLKSAFILAWRLQRERAGEPPLLPKLYNARFIETLDALLIGKLIVRHGDGLLVTPS